MLYVFVWFVSIATYYILDYTDFLGGSSLIARTRSRMREWFIQKRQQSRAMRILLWIGSICLALRVIVDLFSLAKLK